MGGTSKESTVLALIRSGDSQAALKILFKNRSKPQEHDSPSSGPTSKSDPLFL